MSSRESGFTLIELIIATGIVAALAGISVPAYRIYAQNSAMTVAEANLRNGLQYFAAGEGHHPVTGSLDDLVHQGYLPNIPNDPWTSQSPAVNNTEEVGDWFYSNDGQEIVLYALSGKGQVIKTPSLGIAAPGIATPAAPVSAKAAAALKKAANWTAKAAKAQAQIDALAPTLASRQQALASAQEAYAANPSKKNKNTVNKAQQKVNSTNKTISKLQKNMATYQAKADKFTAQAAKL